MQPTVTVTKHRPSGLELRIMFRKEQPGFGADRVEVGYGDAMVKAAKLNRVPQGERWMVRDVQPSADLYIHAHYADGSMGQFIVFHYEVGYKTFNPD